MKVKELTFERVFNIGNYESERIGIVMTVDDGEKAADVMEKMKAFVYAQAVKQDESKNAQGLNKLLSK